MKRSAPLKNKTPMKRTGRLKVKGRRRFAGRSDPAYREWIRRQPCTLVGTGECRGAIEACHVKSKGAGGGDQANLYPACGRHHGEQHTAGIKSFQAKYAIDLRRIANALAVAYADGENWR